MGGTIVALALAPAVMGGVAAVGPGMVESGVIESGGADERLAEAMRHAAARRLDQAAAAFAEILESDPDNVSALVGLAWVNNDRNEYGAAAVCALRAVNLQPGCSPAWREYGYALWRSGRIRPAVRALSEAIEADRRDWTAYDYLIALHDQEGEAAKADAVRRAKARAEERQR